MRPKRCKQCKRPVGKTRGGLGFCKACLKEALRQQGQPIETPRGTELPFGLKKQGGNRL